MFPMGMVLPKKMTAACWKSKLFTTTTTFVVPPDVGCIWIDGCGGGSGGGGGDPTPGGGGGGGSATWVCRFFPLAVTPGETLTLTIGAGGLGGAPGANSSNPGETKIAVGSETRLTLSSAYLGYKGEPGAGGEGGGPLGDIGGKIYTPIALSPYQPAEFLAQKWSGGMAGGALNVNGVGRGYMQNITGDSFYGGGGTGGPLGGGGGAGGVSAYGVGGNGGSNGAAGSNATGYGCGGGGGSGNAKGGDGSPGFVRIYCFTAYDC